VTEPEPTSESAALTRCHANGAAGNYAVAEAAEQRLKRFGVTTADVRHAIENAYSASPVVKDGRTTWNIAGLSVDGTEIVLNVAFDGDNLVLVLG